MCHTLSTAGVAPKYLLQTLTKRLLTDRQLMEVRPPVLSHSLTLFLSLSLSLSLSFSLSLSLALSLSQP